MTDDQYIPSSVREALDQVFGTPMPNKNGVTKMVLFIVAAHDPQLPLAAQNGNDHHVLEQFRTIVCSDLGSMPLRAVLLTLWHELSYGLAGQVGVAEVLEAVHRIFAETLEPDNEPEFAFTRVSIVSLLEKLVGFGVIRIEWLADDLMNVELHLNALPTSPSDNIPEECLDYMFSFKPL